MAISDHPNPGITGALSVRAWRLTPRGASRYEIAVTGVARTDWRASLCLCRDWPQAVWRSVSPESSDRRPS